MRYNARISHRGYADTCFSNGRYQTGVCPELQQDLIQLPRNISSCHIVWAKGTQPLALFLQRHISNSSFTKAAAAVSMFFCIIVAITVLLQQVGSRGFDTRG